MPNLLAGCRGSVPSPSSASQPLPHFQPSMLLHNLSSVFSLRKKASQRALRCTRVPHRTTATAHPSTGPHQTAPGDRLAPALHRRCPGAPDSRPAAGRTSPIHRETSFPQSFPHFRRFPQRLSFPLAFFERNSVRSSAQLVLTAQ